MEALFPKMAVTTKYIGSAAFCDYPTITAAFQKAHSHTVFYLLPGIYQETPRLYGKEIQVIGLGEVIIEGKLSARQKDANGKPLGTFQTATFFVNGEEILLKNLTIRNAAGPGECVGQAVALYLEGTKITVENCHLQGHQDTLCLGPLPESDKHGRPLQSPWREKIYEQQQTRFIQCEIEGTVDFIFGGGNGQFMHCLLKSLKRVDSDTPNYLTAASTCKGQPGFVFENCVVVGEQPYFLGRPWRPHAATRFSHCFFDKKLAQEGWEDWNKPEQRLTSRYAEENCWYEASPKRAAWITFKSKEDKQDES